jgi:cytoskeletal protein CcmA (bactofilin family)
MGKIDTLIGKTAHLRGDLTFSGALHLEGRISGHVRAAPGAGSTLSVSKCGCIEGAVDVANVILDGTVTGPIRARGRVVLGPAARVYGDVHYGNIEMALGAEILGRLVRMAADPRTPANAAKLEARLSEPF